MSVDQHDVVDFVAVDPAGIVVLVMVEGRDWGEPGSPDLKQKLGTYYDYITTGQLADRYPALAEKKVRIELRCVQLPGSSEADFLDTVKSKVFEPLGIDVKWTLWGGCLEAVNGVIRADDGRVVSSAVRRHQRAARGGVQALRGLMA